MKTLTTAAVALLATTALMSGCTANSSSSATPVQPSSSSPTQLSPPAAGGLKWHPTSQIVNGTAPVQVATVNKGAIALMWMNPDLLRFRFVPGYRYPERSPHEPADSRPKTWLRGLVAAFNGGFKLSDHAGGYVYHGTVVSPLRAGLATLTVDSTGKLDVGVWHSGESTNTIAIRQNLTPLIAKGVLAAGPHDLPNRWGLSLGHQSKADRTALGQLQDGSLVFATGNHVSEFELGSALAKIGVQTAIALDMNHTWPTGYYYDAARPGKRPVGHKILAETYYPPSKYYSQDKKDFIVAQLRP